MFCSLAARNWGNI